MRRPAGPDTALASVLVLTLASPARAATRIIEVKDPGAGEEFNDWLATTTRLSARFEPDRPGTYRFRARLARFGGGLIVGSSMYSPTLPVTVP
jgi:hypothetical protein